MKYYTLDMLEKAYRREYPDMPEKLVQKKAEILHKKLNTLDKYWKRSNQRFYHRNELV
jgi:hypothetical protein